MRCSFCETENKKGAKFCKRCGQPMTSNTARTTRKIPENPREIPERPKQTKQIQIEDPDRILKIVIPIVFVAILLIGGIFAFKKLGVLTPTIDLNKYLVIEAKGTNGYGTVSEYVDWEKIAEKYGKKIKYTKEGEKLVEEYGIYGEIVTAIELLSECIDIDIDKKSGLSNDDEINYKWDIEQSEIDKYFKCKLKYNDGTYTVSGLEEMGEFDVFADVDVSFTGTAPNGRAEIHYTGEELNSYDFSLDKSSGLSNGDIVTASIDQSCIQRLAESKGMVPEEMQQQYTVEGLIGYITDPDEIDPDMFDQMMSQAEDEFHAHVAKKWEQSESLESLEYIGNYFLSAKDTDTWNAKNALYLVYKVKVHPYHKTDAGEVYDEDKDYYWYIQFSNLMGDPDGTTDVALTDYHTPSNTFEIETGLSDGAKWYYYGYETLDELYKDVVTANANAYSHKDNVKQ